MSRASKARTTLPHELRIGPYVYTVERVEELDDEDHIGEVDGRALSISITEGLAPDVERATLLHEAIHCIFDATGLDEFVGEYQEFLVCALEASLFGLLRDNPHLVAYMLE